MPNCLIGLGANLGDRARSLSAAVAQLAAHPQIEVVAQSRWQETDAIGGPTGQLPYLNGAVRIDCSLNPQQLFDHIQQIEHDLGRTRDIRWGPRTVDLDLLLYGEEIVSRHGIEVPHPRMAMRRFVLEPAAQIAAEMPHPVLGRNIARLLTHLNTSLPYVALAGPPGSGKTQLAASLAEQLPAIFLRTQECGTSAETEPIDDAWRNEIERLRARGQSLDRASWPHEESAVISDFWYDQSLAYAMCLLTPEQVRRFEDRWLAARTRVVQPRLIVLLARPRATPPATGDDRWSPLSEKLATLARRPGQPPWLECDAVDEGRRFDEVLAAVQSMQ